MTRSRGVGGKSRSMLSPERLPPVRCRHDPPQARCHAPRPPPPMARRVRRWQPAQDAAARQAPRSGEGCAAEVHMTRPTREQIEAARADDGEYPLDKVRTVAERAAAALDGGRRLSAAEQR